MLLDYKLGQTGIILRVKVRDSTQTDGRGKTGLTNASTGLVIATIADNEAATTSYTAAGATIDTITTLGTYAAPTTGHCRFKEVDAANHPGIYEIQLADARYAVSGARSLIVSVSGATGTAQCDAVIPLRRVDPYDGAAFGLANLDAAVSSRSTFGLTTALATPRALDAIADTSLTVNDALHCATAAAAGKEAIVGTTYTVKTPSTGTILRTFSLDSGTSPTSRS